MIDKMVLDAIHFAAGQHGTPDDVVGAVVARMLPSIRLVPQAARSETLPVGGCRIGGCPDLPAGTPWPRRADAAGEDPAEWEPDRNAPLQFILQVNLAEVEKRDVANVLPKTGLLSFFFYWDNDTDLGEEVAHIMLSDPTGLRRVEAPDDLPARQPYRPLELVPRVEWTVPSIEDTGLDVTIFNPARPLDFQHWDFWESIEELVAQAQGFLDPRSAGSVVHRLLGHPQLIQSPGLADGTKLLLQVDSDTSRADGNSPPKTGMMWGDAGRLYYLISDDELKGQRLTEKPWVLVEMC
jgi:uncharacterized protein YwqG